MPQPPVESCVSGRITTARNGICEFSVCEALASAIVLVPAAYFRSTIKVRNARATIQAAEIACIQLSRLSLRTKSVAKIILEFLLDLLHDRLQGRFLYISPATNPCSAVCASHWAVILH